MKINLVCTDGSNVIWEKTKMAEILNSSFMGQAEKISVDTQKVTDNTDIITKSMKNVVNKMELYEAESNIYIKSYEGKSSTEYSNAYRILQYRHKQLDDIYEGMKQILNTNAAFNIKINETADKDAGGK